MTSPESKNKEIYPGTVDFSLTTDGSEATLKFGSFQHTLPHERLDKSVGSNPSICSNLYVGNLEYNTVSEFSQVENLRIRSSEVPLITVKRNSEATAGEPVFEVTADDGSEVQLENNKITVNGVDHHLIWGKVMPKEFNALNEDQIKDYLGNIPNPEDLAFLIMAPIIKEDANSQELNKFMTDKEQEVKGRLILEISRDLLGFIAGRSGIEDYKTEHENIVVRMMQSGLGGKYLFTQEGQTDFRMICLKLLESGEASKQLKNLDDPRGSFFKSFSEYVGINHQDPKFETEYFLNLLNSIHSGGYRMSEVVQGSTSLVNAIMLWGMGGEYSQSMLFQHLPEDVRDMLNQCDDRLVLKYETKAKVPLTLEEAYDLLRASDETSQKSIEYPLDDAIEWAGDSSEQLKRVLIEAHNRDREKSTQ